MRFIYISDAFNSCLFNRNTPEGIGMAWTSFMDGITNYNGDHKRGDSITCTNTRRRYTHNSSLQYTINTSSVRTDDVQLSAFREVTAQIVQHTWHLRQNTYVFIKNPCGVANVPTFIDINITETSTSVLNWAEIPYRRCVSIQL